MTEMATIKLFYAPPLASLAVVMLAQEIKTPLTLIEVDPQTGLCEDGRILSDLSAKKCLPILERSDGFILTETSIILSWLASQDPELKLTAPPNSQAYFQIHEWMVYFATEQHKLYTLLFWDIDEAAKQAIKKRIQKRFSIVEQRLENRDFLVGDKLTIADIYLFIMVRGALHLLPNFHLERDYPNLHQHRKYMCERPAIISAVEQHGGGF